jgi:hypothetical protein
MPLVNKTFSDIITFDRASSATMFDSSGTLVYAPMNLFTYSEEFDNADWTYSLFVKQAERTAVRVLFPAAAFTSNLTANFDISTGAWRTSSPAPSAQLTLSVEILDNGWYRISATATATATAASTILLYLLDSPSNTGSYSGDGTSGLYIWGAQFNQTPMQGGVTADLSTYYPTTSAAYQGPRLDYDPATLAARGLLIEEQRTNSIRNNTMQGAVAGTPGTAPTNWSVSSAGGLSREVVGSGTINGINYIDIRIFGTTTNANLALNLYSETATQIAALNGQTWTNSLWAQIVGGSITGISQIYLTIVEINAGGSDLAYLSGTDFKSTIGTFSRRIYTAATTNASTAFIRPGFWVSTTGIGAVIDITLRIGLGRSTRSRRLPNEPTSPQRQRR